MPQPSGLPELPEVIADLIAANDGPFKHHLDRFKYATRHRGEDPQDHQRAALRILLDWNSRLRWGEALGDAGTSGIADAAVGHPWCAETPWLLGGRSCLADWALLPFVRQFRQADPQGLDSHPELGAEIGRAHV